MKTVYLMPQGTEIMQCCYNMLVYGDLEWKVRQSKSYLKQCLKCTECQLTRDTSTYQTKYYKKHDWQRHKIDFRILCSINRETFPVPPKICLLIAAHTVHSVALFERSCFCHSSHFINHVMKFGTYTTVMYLKCVFQLQRGCCQVLKSMQQQTGHSRSCRQQTYLTVFFGCPFRHSE